MQNYSQCPGTSGMIRAFVLSSTALCAMAIASPQAHAKDVYLAAVRTCVTPTGGSADGCAIGGTASAVPVWSFVAISPAEFSAKALLSTTHASAVVPGPLLNVDSSDTSGLSVHLLNLLPVPTSLIIPGQPAKLNPTWFNPATGAATGTGARQPGDTTSRVRSLNTETAAGATGIYTWSGLKPGSFIYESATHQGVQVQMGLHGGLIVASGATTTKAISGAAYPGVSYTQQVATYLSEIDATMHATVDASPTHDATPAGAAVKVSPIEYWPNIFLTTQTILAPDFTPTASADGHTPLLVNQPTLMRFFNGSLRSHVQMVQNQNMAVIAEDGNPYRYAKNQYSVLLDAGKTKDTLFTPTVLETVAVYDRMLNTGGVGSAHQGMVAYLDVFSPSTPTANNDSYTTPMGVALIVPATGVLTNDVSHDNQKLSAQLVTQAAHGTVVLASDGSFTYTPAAGSTATSDAFAYKASETVAGTTYLSNQATVVIALTVVKPVATADRYYVTNNASGTATLTVAAPGVLSNDVPSTGVTAKLVSGPTHGSLTSPLSTAGAFTYRSQNTYVGADSFTYTTTATNSGLVSAPATVTINVLAAPRANNDAIAVVHGATGTAINVVANDVGYTSGSPVTIVQAPIHGTATPNANGTVIYSNTSALAGQNDSFTYTFVNAAGAVSTTGTVTITVN